VRHGIAMTLALPLLWALNALADGPSTALAQAGEWRPHLRAFARISARQQTRLSLPFGARIRGLPVQPGGKVAAGDLLATFDAPRLRRHLAAWQQARREVRLARKHLKLLRTGNQEHTLTRHDLMAGEQAAQQAEGRSELAWETLAADLDQLNQKAAPDRLARRIHAIGLSEVARGLGRLKAPFAGLVRLRHAAEGEQLAAGDPILELESLDPVYLDVGVPKSQLTEWRRGQSYWQGGGEKVILQPLAGVPRLDADTGLWLLRLVAHNPGYRLRDGAWIEVHHLGDPRTVAWVPGQAVVSRNGRDWVIVPGDKGPKPVEVRVGPTAADGLIPVLKGLEPGTQVVTEGAYEQLYRDLKDLIKFVD